jgi:hypothetical protein
MQLITSYEHFVGHVAGHLARAQKNLQADGDLRPVVLFERRDVRVETYVHKLPAELITPLIQEVVAHRGDIELVTFVSLGWGVTPEQFERLPERPMDHPDKIRVIGCEGSHVDFGYVRMHCAYSHSGETWTFDPICHSMAPEKRPLQSLLTELWWPKRKLNS